MGLLSTLFGSVTSKIYAAIIVALLVAAGLCYWQYTSYEKKFDDANAALTTTRSQLKEANETITKLQQSQLISENTRTEIDQDKTVIDKKVADTQVQENVKIKAITDEYKDKPVTPENQAAEATKIAAVRVDSMWTTYCVSGAVDAPCAAASAASAASGVSP